MATMRKNGQCFRPIFFMRIRTATGMILDASGKREGPVAAVEIRDAAEIVQPGRVTNGPRPAAHPAKLLLFTALVLLALLFPLLGPLLGALAVSGADLTLEHARPGQERAHLAEAGDGLHALPDAHFSHLAHHGPHLIELGEELLDLARLDAAAGRDPPPPALVDH